MASPTGPGPPHAPVPPGWPGDDPTVPEDLSLLGRPGQRPPRAGAGWRDGRVADRDRRRRGAGAAPPDRHEHDHAGEPRQRGPGASRRPGERRGRDPASDPGHDVTDGHDLPDDHRDHDDLVAGVQPAGRVLVVMVASLLLAMLVNTDALVERAERKPAGAERDRSLAIWHPVQDVSHALQLHRVRQIADRLAGDDGDAPAEPLVSPRASRRAPGQPRNAAAAVDGDAPGPGDNAAAGVPQVRAPTADEPLRLWVGGDSMAEVFGRSLVAAAEATELVDATLHYEMASGLTRPDYYDWPAALAADVAAGDPEVVVVVLGVNDGQGIVLDDGTPVPELSDHRWPDEYRRRVGALMDQLRAGDRWVVWVAQPPMREPGYAARLAIINQIHAAEAASRPWVTLVDTAAVLGDADGGYTPGRPDATGAPVAVRRDDGIHLTPAGADLLAARVLDVIGGRVGLSR